ncbi:hypothetical protein [Micromonospora wenchangensis]|uniref:hypothetical protein n=1 Tax=Micromonospora wenchangensis TaxID=1185415 RepID=UPI00380835DD
MATLTFAAMRSFHIFHGGEVHAHWCHHLAVCDGQCTASADFPTIDGRTFTVTATLPHDALWLTFTAALDGQPATFNPHLHTVEVCDAIHRQIRVWNESIPNPVHRAAPAGGVR